MQTVCKMLSFHAEVTDDFYTHLRGWNEEMASPSEAVVTPEHRLTCQIDNMMHTPKALPGTCIMDVLASQLGTLKYAAGEGRPL